MTQAARAAVTADLAAALAGLDPTALSPAVAERAQRAFLDTLAVMAPGMGEAPVQAVSRMLAAEGGMRGARDRALLLGTAAHALDFDDVAFGGHVSAVVVPAILALLPDLRRIDGRRVLLAYAAGVEAWAEISTRETTLYHARGGHPTGILGPIGAAGAAAVLLALSTAETRNALAIAASAGAGLTVQFGTMTKPVHAGRAAEAGVAAALLARAGLSAAPDAFEAPNGFLPVHSPKGELDLTRPVALRGSGLRLEQAEPSIKRYPICYAAHRSADAAMALHSELVPDEIARIEITLSPRHAATLRYDRPETVAEARFSLEFAVCCALLYGKLGLGELTQARLADPALTRLIGCCARRLSDTADPVLDGFAAFDQVSVTLRDGRRIGSPEIRRAAGHADNPIPRPALLAKLSDCFAASGMPFSAERLDNTLRAIAGDGDPAALTEMLETLLMRASPDGA
ncbi:MmgE/PrpD family protein [Salipiger abyssi]|uniref:MmgE/PrpD family protein n=1 Tax=Salipiger abyssi TaxID=1250539 RepID=UPI001A90106A|nr:MmgE/PrpD family protein [Salipiger abyssi]MBN9887286.1 MmgE/PrpD family protein [Salipiger abyssi]